MIKIKSHKRIRKNGVTIVKSHARKALKSKKKSANDGYFYDSDVKRWVNIETGDYKPKRAGSKPSGRKSNPRYGDSPDYGYGNN